ncbi:RHS repeat-associated core domain-containing protein [Bordetella bronchialis]|nr:RHS repeat-associated core domain-containing protein [Bordetella bronchialis]
MLRRYAGVVYDPVTAYYNLGNGSRSYLPYLMRFCAPDVRSPFGVGGVNTYAYCKGDPINYADPDGHVPVASLESLAARAALRAMEGASEKVSLPVHEIEKDLAAEGPLFKRIQHALWQSPMPRAASDVRRLPWTVNGKRAEIYTFDDSFGRYGRRKNIAVHGDIIDGEPYVSFSNDDAAILVGPQALAGQVGDLSGYDVVRLVSCHTAEGEAPFAQQFARAVNRPVVGFMGPMNSSFPLPERISDTYDMWEEIAREDNHPPGSTDRRLREQYEGRLFGNNPAFYRPRLFLP